MSPEEMVTVSTQNHFSTHIELVLQFTSFNDGNHGQRNGWQGGSLVLFAECGEEWLGIPSVFA
jgi:hypothetical protein